MQVESFKQFIEKRSHPELNPKLSAYEQLLPYSKLDDYYISFTKENKLGINPHSEFETPLGIYTYILKETWAEYVVDVNKDFSEYPYAQHSPYIWLIKPKNAKRGIEVSEYTKNDLERDIERLKTMFDADDIDSLYKNLKKRYSNNFEVFWRITRTLADSNIVKWNSILSKFYDYVSDKKGLGLIHPNEPIQAVFFNIKSIEIVDKFLNKKYNSSENGLQHIASIEDIKESITLLDILTNSELYIVLSAKNTVELLDKTVVFLDKPFKDLLVSYISKYSNDIEKEIKTINFKLKSIYALELFSLLCLLLVDLKTHHNIKQFILDNLQDIDPKILSSFYIQSVLEKFKLRLDTKLYMKNVKTLDITKEDDKDEKIKLLEKYKRIIFKKTDIHNLTNEERAHIKNIFKSEFLFLNELSKYQMGEDDVLF